MTFKQYIVCNHCGSAVAAFSSSGALPDPLPAPSRFDEGCQLRVDLIAKYKFHTYKIFIECVGCQDKGHLPDLRVLSEPAIKERRSR